MATTTTRTRGIRPDRKPLLDLLRRLVAVLLGEGRRVVDLGAETVHHLLLLGQLRGLTFGLDLIDQGHGLLLELLTALWCHQGCDPGTDRGYVYGGGIGYRLGETFRIGFDSNYYTRRSEIEERRDFEGLRLFGSISYGIQQ